MCCDVMCNIVDELDGVCMFFFVFYLFFLPSVLDQRVWVSFFVNDPLSCSFLASGCAKIPLSILFSCSLFFLYRYPCGVSVGFWVVILFAMISLVDDLFLVFFFLPLDLFYMNKMISLFG